MGTTGEFPHNEKWIDLDALAIGDVTRLRYVRRFSTCHVIHPESVAEHSFYVALYALAVCDWLRIAQPSVFGAISIGDVLRKAILHDLEEAKTGDVVRTFKYANPALATQFQDVAAAMMRDLVAGIYDSHQLRDQWVRDWGYAKCGAYVGAIIEFADFFSVLSYMATEIHRNNRTMREHARTMQEYFCRFETDRFDFMRPLIERTHAMLDRYLAI